MTGLGRLAHGIVFGLHHHRWRCQRPPQGHSPGTGSPPYAAGTARQLPPDFILIPHADRTVGSEKLILAVRDFKRVLRDLRDGMLPSLKLNGTTVSGNGRKCFV